MGMAGRGIVAAAIAAVLAIAAPPAQLKISGTTFIAGDGTPFEWRGISAYRLLEFVAHGHEAEADAYLRWAASKKLTVVRVFAMADGIFQLTPADGQHALPRLLEIAAKHGLYVEVVAFTGTSVIKVDMPRFVKAIGEICARYPNALIELANEPGHPTQSKSVHDAAFMKSLGDLVPAQVPLSLGSVEYGDGFAAGRYVTWHAPRTAAWHREMAKGADLLRRFKKPVVSDEPIGAADKSEAGRRDNDPARFRAAGAEARRIGIGSTFHYDGGIQARLLTPTEMACLDAWLEGYAPDLKVRLSRFLSFPPSGGTSRRREFRPGGTYRNTKGALANAEAQQRRLRDGLLDGREERVGHHLIAGGPQVESVGVDVFRFVAGEQRIEVGKYFTNRLKRSGLCQ